MKFQDCFLLRIWLVFASLVSLLLSFIYLLFFTLPHASWMPLVPDWQDLAPKFLAQLHKDTDWQPNDGKFLLLVSVTNFVGSIGYDRSSFYNIMSPYWGTVLTTTSIFSLFMVLASLLMLWYLICNYRLSLRFIPIPWLILQVVVLFMVQMGLVFMLVDMDSPSRLEMELLLGKGNYAMTITGMMAFILYLYICILIAYIHMDDMMMEKERLDRLAKFIRLVDINISRSQPEVEQQQQVTSTYNSPSHTEEYLSLGFNNN